MSKGDNIIYMLLLAIFPLFLIVAAIAGGIALYRYIKRNKD